MKILIAKLGAETGRISLPKITGFISILILILKVIFNIKLVTAKIFCVKMLIAGLLIIIFKEGRLVIISPKLILILKPGIAFLVASILVFKITAEIIVLTKIKPNIYVIRISKNILNKKKHF